ncbi:MAG TPA: adenylate/guanylate cyclase domain-containing protein [Chitinophagaceae bacterium]|nr:adenylate/guanylate cyclase domain-containing protein [Chitinophagaceae bacterium]
MSQSRQLAAIMFTDIVGYTALMQENEQKAVTIIKHYNSSLNQLVSLHHGKVLNYYGDGSLCIFSSVTEAMNCAVELQKELQTEPAVPLRLGMHVGEIFFEGKKALGDGVNIASRIQSLGQANAIFFSREIFDKLRNQPEFKSVSLGLFEFKNVSEPMEIFALANEGLVIPKREEMTGKLKEAAKSRSSGAKSWMIVAAAIVLFAAIYFGRNIFNTKSVSTTKGKSVAVLYFDNMSGDQTQEYFSDGVTEEIISRLATINGLRVKSRTSVAQYKNKGKGIKEIGKELGVNYILEGSVRQQNNKVRITAQLIDAETNDHIWSENYDRDLTDIFSVQTDIAQQIAKKFQIKLSGANQKKLATSPTTNPGAYDIYLKATSLVSPMKTLGGAQPDRTEAMGLLRQAIQLDPNFSDAYALLSENYTYTAASSANPKLLLDSAVVFAKKAIDLAPDRDAGYKAMAYEKFWEGLPDQQLNWLLKAHEIKPFSSVFDIVGNYSKINNYKKAYEWVKMGMEHDPVEPYYYAAEAFLYLKLQMLDSLKNCIDRARRLKLESPELDQLAILYYLNTGKYEEYSVLCKQIFALDEKEYALNIGIFYLFRRVWKKADSCLAVSSKPDEIDAGLAKIKLGKQDEGRRILNKVIEQRLKFAGFEDMWHNRDVSRCYAALKDSRYIEYLNKAVQKGWHFFSDVEADPYYDEVSNSPEFKKIRQSFYEKNEKYKADLLAAIKEFNR